MGSNTRTSSYENLIHSHQHMSLFNLVGDDPLCNRKGKEWNKPSWFPYGGFEPDFAADYLTN